MWSVGCYGNKTEIVAFEENKVNFSTQQPSQWGRNKTVLSLLRVICVNHSCVNELKVKLITGIITKKLPLL